MTVGAVCGMCPQSSSHQAVVGWLWVCRQPPCQPRPVSLPVSQTPRATHSAHLLLKNLQSQLGRLILALAGRLAPLVRLRLASCRLLISATCAKAAPLLTRMRAVRRLWARTAAAIRCAGRLRQRAAVPLRWLLAVLLLLALLRMLHRLPLVRLLHLHQVPALPNLVRRRPALLAGGGSVAELQGWRCASTAAAAAAGLREAVQRAAKCLKAARRQGRACRWRQSVSLAPAQHNTGHQHNRIATPNNAHTPQQCPCTAYHLPTSKP